jgi:phenylpropionate dioxygenase-like ring-hydroxylating dioxygenase large terminal subunit
MLAAASSEAHHSAAVYFDLSKEITVEGVVKEFQLGNPHARIFLTVKGPGGEEQQWMAEGGSRTVMLRKGWTGENVKPGDVVKIVGQPARNGTNVVHWEWLVLPDGKQLWGEDIDPRKLQELRERRN